MEDLDTIYERAKDEPPFSNGTCGYGWMDAWCNRCWHDRLSRQSVEGPGCPLLGVALLGRTPQEWLPGDPCKPDGFSIPDQYSCVMFRHEDDGGDPEARPVPTPPGQGELFPRDGLEGVRLLKPYPVETPQAVA